MTTTHYASGPVFTFAVEVGDGPAVQLPADGTVIVRAASDDRAVGCAHHLRVVGNRITGMVDMRADTANGHAVLDDYRDGYPHRLLPELVRVSASNRRLVTFRDVVIDLPDSGELTLLSEIGARAPADHRAAEAALAERNAAAALSIPVTAERGARAGTAPATAIAAPAQPRYVAYPGGTLIGPAPVARFVNGVAVPSADDTR